MKCPLALRHVFIIAGTIFILGSAYADPPPTINANFEPQSGSICDTVNEIPSTECKALVALYNNTDGDNWIDNTDWNVTNTPCSWYGLTCSGGHVSQLSLSFNQLSGEIPPELGQLSSLQGIWLDSNQLSGEIPPELGPLSSLQYLYLDSNQLSGEIPAELGDLSSLQVLWLSGNQLSGEIPAEMGQLSSLQGLRLSENQLSGPIPPELGDLSNLQYLLLYGNQLCGEIPSELMNLDTSLGGSLLVLLPSELMDTSLGGSLSALQLQNNNLINDETAYDADFIAWLDKMNSDWRNQVSPSYCSLLQFSAADYNVNEEDGSVTLIVTRSGASSKGAVSVDYATSDGSAIGGSDYTPTSGTLNWADGDTSGKAITVDIIDDSETENDETFFVSLSNPIGDAQLGIPDTAVVTIKANDSIQNTLTVTKSGTGSGTVISSPEGIDCGTDCSEDYDSGTEVTLTATADGGSTFIGWSGDCSGASCSVTMDTDHTVDAQFDEIPESICETVTEIPKPECDALVALYNNTDGDNWVNNTGWKVTDMPCSWHGLTCSGGYVSQLSLSFNHLSGEIPLQLGDLSNLENLSLDFNQLSGPIPAQLGNLINLKFLRLSANQLSGPIPPELGNLINLETLYLYGNQLCGKIPDSLMNLTKLYGPPYGIKLQNNNLINDETAYDADFVTWLDEKDPDWRNQVSPSYCSCLQFSPADYNNSVIENEGPVTLTVIRSGGSQGAVSVDYATSDGTAIAGSDYIHTEGTLNWADGETSDKPIPPIVIIDDTEPESDENFFVSLSNLIGDAQLCEPYTAEVTITDNDQNTLTVTKSGTGSGTVISSPPGINCGTDCTENYSVIEDVTLTATPDFNSIFIGWSGDCSGTSCSVTMDTNHTVDAQFDESLGCETVTEIPKQECEALIALYENTDGDNWLNNSGWYQSSTPCSWHGVSCSDGQVSQLSLSFNQLSGPIPPQLGQLSRLTRLYLYNNELSGEIPAQLGQLSSLQTLRLSFNQLSGEIPPELGMLSRLQNLLLYSNQLSGEIPPELGQLKRLEYLYLDSNQLSGPIPPQLAHLNKLQIIWLDSNQLSGPIPPELGLLSNLQGLRLSGNQLSGPIPPELGQLSNLEYLLLSGNQLCGKIPSELMNLDTSLGGSLSALLPSELMSQMDTMLGESLSALQLQNNNLINDETVYDADLIAWLDKINPDWRTQVSPSYCSLLQFSAADYNVNEGDGSATITVTRSGDTQGAVSVDYVTSDDSSATAGSDYTPTSGTLNWNDGDDADKTFIVEIIDDSDPENDETFIVSLDNPTGDVQLGTPDTAVVTIKANDSNQKMLSVTKSGSGQVTSSPAGIDCGTDCSEDYDYGTEVTLTATPEFRSTFTGWSGSCTGTSCSVTMDTNHTVNAQFEENPDPLCDTVIEIPNTECEALVELYNSTDGDNWKNNTGWNKTYTPCNWYGVSCSGGHVSQLSLYSNQLSGVIPPELGQLSRLQYLWLDFNQLSGEIPQQLGDLSNLKSLWLDFNQLSGPIPAELGQLSRLQYLWLNYNQLSGEIPAELGQLSNLKSLYLDSNQLSGPIPSQLDQLSRLQSLQLSDNQLCGKIPEELMNLDTSLGGSLSTLDLQKNNLINNETVYDADFIDWLYQMDLGWRNQVSPSDCSLLQFSAADYNVNEGDDFVTLTVTRSGDSQGAVSVEYATSDDGTATVGSDYTATSGTLEWPEGDAADKTFTVPIIDDSELESDETFIVSLDNPTGEVQLGTPDTAVVTIRDNDSALIGVAPASLEASQATDTQTTQVLTISNTGDADLDWNIAETETTCSSPGDIPWVSISPASGTTPESGSSTVDVVFDSTDLAMDNYTGTLCINSNDLTTPLVEVPVSLQVTASSDIRANDLVIDFGSESGIWAWMNNDTWADIHSQSPISMVIGDIDDSGQDDLIADFSSDGIWILMNYNNWLFLHSLSAESMTTGDMDSGGLADVIIDFGSDGIWVWMNNSSWVKLHSLSAESMTTGDMDSGGLADVIIDFGSSDGIWVWMNNSSWVKLHSLSAESMTTGDMDGGGLADVIIDFGSTYGIWVRMNNSDWTQLHSLSPNSMTTGDMDGNGQADVVIDFGEPYGIWVRMNNSSWVKLHSVSPNSMTTGYLDNNAQADVIIDFGLPYGIWVRMNNDSWVKLHSSSAEAMMTGNIDGLPSVSSNSGITTQEGPAELDNAEPLPEADFISLPID